MSVHFVQRTVFGELVEVSRTVLGAKKWWRGTNLAINENKQVGKSPGFACKIHLVLNEATFGVETRWKCKLIIFCFQLTFSSVQFSVLKKKQYFFDVGCQLTYNSEKQ